MRRLSLSVLLLAAVSTAGAQQQPGGKPADAKDNQAKTQQRSGRDSDKSKDSSASDSFTPSERIKADTTVAFPADI